MAEHPITPPPELVAKLWREASAGRDDAPIGEIFSHGVLLAYAAGADQELEACCEWLDSERILCKDGGYIRKLRAARRPKPPRLKAQALGALSRADKDALTNPLTGEVVALRTILNKEQSDTIRRALEALPE